MKAESRSVDCRGARGIRATGHPCRRLYGSRAGLVRTHERTTRRSRSARSRWRGFRGRLRPGITLDRLDGMTKLVLDPKTERVLGVGIVGPGAGELIAEGVLAVEMGANATDIRMTIHPHPTLSETIMESAEVFFGQATHVYRPKKKAAGS